MRLFQGRSERTVSRCSGDEGFLRPTLLSRGRDRGPGELLQKWQKVADRDAEEGPACGDADSWQAHMAEFEKKERRRVNDFARFEDEDEADRIEAEIEREEENAASRLSSSMRLARGRRWLIARGTCFILLWAADIVLDVYTAIHFFLQGKVAYGWVVCSFVFLPAVHIFFRRVCATCHFGGSLPALSYHTHFEREATRLKLVKRLSQNALFKNLHIRMCPPGPEEGMTWYTSIVTCLLMVYVQARAYSEDGGAEALNYVSLVSSALCAVLGVVAWAELIARRRDLRLGLETEKPPDPTWDRDANAGARLYEEVSLSGCKISRQMASEAAWLASQLVAKSALNLAGARIVDVSLQAFQGHDLRLVAVDLAHTRVADCGVLALAESCPALCIVSLAGCTSVTDSAVESLTHFCKHLRSVDLSSTDVTDACGRVLTRVSGSLECLSIRDTRMTDAGVEALADCCSGLRSVRLSSLVTDAGVIKLARSCRGLRAVYLGGCTVITDNALEVLSSKCPLLQTLDLKLTDVTDEGVKLLAEKCSRLRAISLEGTKATDDSVFCIADKCLGLRGINLSMCEKVTDEAALRLRAKCAFLQFADLSKTAVKDEGKASLRERCTHVA